MDDIDGSEHLKQEIRALRAKLEKKDDVKNYPKDDVKNYPVDYWSLDVEQKIAFLEKETRRIRERYGHQIRGKDLEYVCDLEEDLDFYKTLKFHIDKICDKVRADLLKEFSNIPRCPYDYIR
jgi:hypothetical protein